MSFASEGMRAVQDIHIDESLMDVCVMLYPDETSAIGVLGICLFRVTDV
jgi:hypothetical protein